MEHDEPGRLPILISYACFARPQVGTRAPERLRLTVQGRQTWGYCPSDQLRTRHDTDKMGRTTRATPWAGISGPFRAKPLFGRRMEWC